jgi:oxaloacetate decarboxylase
MYWTDWRDRYRATIAGNAPDVMRTVRELQTSGVAAMLIEDTLLPRAFGEKASPVISLEDGPLG